MKKDSKLKVLLRGLLSKEFLYYALFGCLTTVVSVVSYQLCEAWLGLHYSLANVISWILAVTFAYVTNKFFVFRARKDSRSSLLLEMVLFYGARFFSLAIEEGGLFLFIEVFHMNKLLAKIILQVIVVAINYVFSKLVVFKPNEKHDA